MKTFVVTKGTYHVTNDEEVALVAKNLGSGLAICIRDQESRVFGLCYLVVPFLKGKDPEGLPSFECNSGLRAFFKEVTDVGGKREALRTWLVGIGQFLECPKELNVGIHLYSLVKKTLEKNGIAIEGEFVGGPFNKSVQFGLTLGPDVTAPGSKKE